MYLGTSWPQLQGAPQTKICLLTSVHLQECQSCQMQDMLLLGPKMSNAWSHQIRHLFIPAKFICAFCQQRESLGQFKHLDMFHNTAVCFIIPLFATIRAADSRLGGKHCVPTVPVDCKHCVPTSVAAVADPQSQSMALSEILPSWATHENQLKPSGLFMVQPTFHAKCLVKSTTVPAQPCVSDSNCNFCKFQRILS